MKPGLVKLIKAQGFALAGKSSGSSMPGCCGKPFARRCRVTSLGTEPPAQPPHRDCPRGAAVTPGEPRGATFCPRRAKCPQGVCRARNRSGQSIRAQNPLRHHPFWGLQDEHCGWRHPRSETITPALGPTRVHPPGISQPLFAPPRGGKVPFHLPAAPSSHGLTAKERARRGKQMGMRIYTSCCRSFRLRS